MNAVVGWGLAAAALVAGYVGYGWPGVAMAVSAIAFWLLLQFSRSVRALRQAAERPMGQVPSAVMLHAKLQPGMRLPQVLALTRSLGTRLTQEPEVWAWRDEGGDEVHVQLQEGRVTQWELRRAGA